MAHLSTHYDPPPLQPWEGALASGQAVRLAPAEDDRWLHLTYGRVWLTVTDTGHGTPSDCWLAAGDHLALPARTEWVAEAQGPARYLLLDAPLRRGALAARAAAKPRPSVLVRTVWRAWRALSAAWTPSRAQGAISAGDSMASAGGAQ